MFMLSPWRVLRQLLLKKRRLLLNQMMLYCTHFLWIILCTQLLWIILCTQFLWIILECKGKVEAPRRCRWHPRKPTESAKSTSAKDNCASSSRLCSDELQSNRSECQAARDWARANGDAVALWREFERLPKDEFHARIEALKAYKLRMGIESPEEAPTPEEDAGRGKGQRHRRNRRRARAKAQAVLTGSSMSKSAHPSTCDPPQPPSSFADLCSSSNHVECAGTATTWVLQRHITRLLVADHLQKEDADWDAVFHAWDKMATLRERANFYLKQATLHRLCEAYHRDGEEDADIQRLWEQCRLDKIRMHRIAGWCFGHWRCLTFYSSGAQRLMEQRLQSHIRNLCVTFWP